IAAADAVAAGSRQVMALCRPPGHHAYRDRASGFCFLNNAAIAVGVLQKRFRRIAIVDFDTHHGDGTQAIFYGNASVLVASTHTDPSAYYPFYIGYEDERGIGAGIGTNLNVPLAEGSGDDTFLAASHQLLAAVDTFAPDAIIVSAGWDAHRDDPLSKLDVTTEAYAALGDLLGQRAEPIVILQEGGYSLTAIEQAAVTFLDRFEAARSG
ncbi:MAG: histone deacetylase family protein, partial [Pseudomonadota bacterium]